MREGSIAVAVAVRGSGLSGPTDLRFLLPPQGGGLRAEQVAAARRVVDAWGDSDVARMLFGEVE